MSPRVHLCVALLMVAGCTKPPAEESQDPPPEKVSKAAQKAPKDVADSPPKSPPPADVRPDRVAPAAPDQGRATVPVKAASAKQAPDVGKGSSAPEAHASKQIPVDAGSQTAADAGADKGPGAAVATTVAADDPLTKLTFYDGAWCTVLGSASFRQLDKRAQRLIEKGRKVGFQRTNVFASRSFKEMRWGGLVVIAYAGSLKNARMWAKEAKKHKVKAFAQGCSPARAGPIAPIAQLSDIPKRPAYRPRPFDEKVKSDFPCIGWSPTKGVAVCRVDGKLKLFSSEPVEVDEELPPGEVDAEALNLLRWDDEALDSRELTKAGVLRWSRPRVAVRWKRKKETTYGLAVVGKMTREFDSLLVKCKRELEALVEEDDEDYIDGVRVTLFRAEKGLLIEWGSEVRWLNLTEFCSSD